MFSLEGHSNYLKNKLEKCLFPFQNFHQRYNIQSTKSVSSIVTDNSFLVTFLASSYLINQNYESIFYLN